MAKVPKTPAMPLYGKDAFDDEAFNRLSFGEQGLYWFLAWWQWQEGSIPGEVELVLDKITRRKVAEGRRLWRAVEAFFPILAGSDRRQNANVEMRRQKVCGEREKNRHGANKTNAKRWGHESPCDSDGESLSDIDSESLRAATANASAIGSLSKPTESQEGVPGEVPTPDFEIVAQVVSKIDQSALRTKPSEQLVVAWVGTYGAELILETLVDCEEQYRGKGWQYFAEILQTRREDPSQRPGQRRPRPVARAVSAHTLEGFSKSPIDVLNDAISQFVVDHGGRPGEEPERGEWGVRFTARFGFTVDDWNSGGEAAKDCMSDTFVKQRRA